ncbi:hypothetical protein Tco_1097704 [Tanacetum coccineum]
MSQYLKWLNMRSEEELYPTNVRFPPNKSNVRIDPDETQNDPQEQHNLQRINSHHEVPVIYMQQFWHTVYKNKQSNKYSFTWTTNVLKLELN